MRRMLCIAAALAAMAVVATLVWNAPKQPGIDATETSAVQME